MLGAPLVIATPRTIRFVNVGEDPPDPEPGSGWIGRRQWKACIEHGFISAGQRPIYSKPLQKLIVGDIIAAYITGKGYVGLGKVVKLAVPIAEFTSNGSKLKGQAYVEDSLFDNSERGNLNTEYAVGVEWIKVEEKKNAHWLKSTGLYASRSTQCKLDNQPDTVEFIEACFNVFFVNKGA